MFEITFAIGVFAFSVYFLGLLSLLYQPLLVIFSLLYWIGFFIWKRHIFVEAFKSIKTFQYSPFFLLCLSFLFVQALINAVGLFGPEIGFDATWYHLTIPKLYLMYHAVFHIPGGILYYSDMPRLTEMLYAAGLAFGSDFYARSIHFLFGLLDCIVLYKLGRKFFLPRWAILLPVIFYSNLVVGWESSSGYIDLSRTFFTVMAMYGFFEWIEKKEQKWFVFSALFLGLTISTKLLAIPDFGIYAAVLLFFERNRLSLVKRFQRIFVFVLIALIPCLPWFVFDFVHTGNPVYPVFHIKVGDAGLLDMINPIYLLKTIWETFARASDPINPIFLAILPFAVMCGKKLWRETPLLVIFALGGLLAWYITPQTGGGRYILPYLPAFSLLTLYCIRLLSQKWQKVFIIFIAVVGILSLLYRGAAISKYIPLFTGRETKAHFMQTHLQYNLGDFYDIDGYFAKHIKPGDTVLLYGFHNLYYVDFPFIDSSWVQKGDRFTYVAVQGNGMPERFRYWDLVYFNTTTQVRLYSLKGHVWQY